MRTDTVASLNQSNQYSVDDRRSQSSRNMTETNRKEPTLERWHYLSAINDEREKKEKEMELISLES